MIRKANSNDINKIMTIISEVVPIMQDSGNDQWNNEYPAYEDFYNDILSGSLFVDSEGNGNIKSFVCLNNCEPKEYNSIKWKFYRPALIIHRIAVAPEYHGKGLAKKLFTFAEQKAKELKYNYIRSDTCNRNIGMNILFEKHNYDFSGVLRFPGYKYDFNCYEKYLVQ